MKDIYVVDIEFGNELTSVERLRTLVAETGAPSIAFMVTAVPNEQPLNERLIDWVRRFKILKEGLKDMPVEVGILIQALIGHSDRKRTVGELPYQTIVGSDGTACREVFCPLDAEFQIYTDHLIQELAKTAPAFFMIDDDFRIASHTPAYKGCMCPLHLDRFSQRLGITLTREELLRRFEADDHQEIIDQWEIMKEDSLVELVQVIRDAIDAVDDAIPASFACVKHEVHMAPAIVRTLAGRHQPLVRIHNAIYLEGSHKDFPERVTRSLREIAAFPKGTTILTEADTCPHTRYSLSVKSNLAHITATTLVGCHGAKHWFTKLDDDGWLDTEPFKKMLATTRPFFAEIEKIRDCISWLGPVMLGRLKEMQCKPWEQQGRGAFVSDDWGWRIMGRMGIPFTINSDMPVSEDTAPRALCSTAPLPYTDKELLELLSGPLLLDGAAAWHICQRGLGEHLGVTSCPASFSCAAEMMHVIPESERTKDVISGMTGAGHYQLTVQSKNTRTVSSFVTGSHAGYNTVAPALTWHENKLGGRIAVYGISMRSSLNWIFFNRKRKTQLVETLTWLGGNQSPVVVDTDLDLFVLHGADKTEKNQEYICLFNLNPDTIKPVSIVLPGKPVTSIESLALNGQWSAVAFSTDKDKIKCDISASTMEPLILKLKR